GPRGTGTSTWVRDRFLGALNVNLLTKAVWRLTERQLGYRHDRRSPLRSYQPRSPRLAQPGRLLHQALRLRVRAARTRRHRTGARSRDRRERRAHGRRPPEAPRPRRARTDAG